MRRLFVFIFNRRLPQCFVHDWFWCIVGLMPFFSTVIHPEITWDYSTNFCTCALSAESMSNERFHQTSDFGWTFFFWTKRFQSRQPNCAPCHKLLVFISVRDNCAGLKESHISQTCLVSSLRKHLSFDSDRFLWCSMLRCRCYYSIFILGVSISFHSVKLRTFRLETCMLPKVL